MNQVTEILKGARAILSDPDHWTREFQARNAGGDPVAWKRPEAECFCLMGAINRAAYDINLGYTEEAYEAMNVVERFITNSIPAFNDNPTTDHEAVIKTLDSAIELSRATT